MCPQMDRNLCHTAEVEHMGSTSKTRDGTNSEENHEERCSVKDDGGQLISWDSSAGQGR